MGMRVVVLISFVAMSAGVARADNEDSLILEKLQETTEIDLTNVPVGEAIAYLSDYHLLSISLDTKALKKAGIKPSTALSTLKLNNAPLGLALRAILGPNKLSFMIKHHMLTITTSNEAKEWQKKHFGEPTAGR